MIEKYYETSSERYVGEHRRKYPPPIIVCDPEEVPELRSWWDHQKFRLTVRMIFKLLAGKRIILDNGESTFEIYYKEDKI